MFFKIAFLVLFLGISNAFAAVSVTEDEVREAIADEFVEQGVNEDIDLEFFGGQTSFEIEKASKAKILVSKLRLNELQNKFDADVEVFADGKSFAKTEIQGKYYVLGEVFVPSTNIAKGELIKEDQLKAVKVRMNRIKPVNVVEKDKLIGAEAKRYLKEGKVINDKDIGQKILVKKGDLVTAIYKTKAMQITAKVEALDDGVKGQKIELMNVKSKKTLYGEVVDENTVETDAGL